MTIYRADLAAGPGARLGNAARQIAQLPWFVKNVTLKVMLSLGTADCCETRPPVRRVALLSVDPALSSALP